MLPQLSYVVAQAGVDSRPPPMLPRLTKPFYANGDSTMATTNSITGSTSVPVSQYTPSYYMRPGSSPPPHPPLLPLPTSTSSSVTTTSATMSPYVYPSSSLIMSNTGTNKLSSTSSSVTGPDTGRTSVGLSITPKQRKQQLSPTTTTTTSYHDYSSNQYRHQPSSTASSSGYCQQQTSASSTVYPTYQSSDPWPHRVTAPFVEPGTSSSTYPYATTYPSYTTSPQLPSNDLSHRVTAPYSSSLDYHNPTRQKHQSHTTYPYPYQQEQVPYKSKPQKKQQPIQTLSAQQQHQSRGFMIPDNSTIDHINDTTPDYHSLAYGKVSNFARTEHLKEWNQLLTWMDHEFWEQSEEIYQEKLASLQQELKSLQNDTHASFQDLLSDFELKRETMIADAECFLNYQLEWMEQLYEEDVAVIEEEYNASLDTTKTNEQRNLQDAILSVIEDRKKQVREEKDDHLNEKDLIGEAYSRVTNKRTLRKRPPTEHSRNDARKRHARHAAAHQMDINATLGKEEEELEEELMMMKASTLLPMSLS